VEQKRQRKHETAPRRIIRKPEVRRRTGLSDTTIWRKEKAGEFPQRIQLSPDGMAVGYYEDEVDAFIHSRVRGLGRRPPSMKPPRDEQVETKPTNVAGTGTIEPPNGGHAHARKAKARAPADKPAIAPLKRSRGVWSADRAR
jgi:prophage regulatory protein